MSTDFSPPVGFQPSCRERARKRRGLAVTHLFLTLSLALSTAVAVTAVSIGAARAEALGSMAGDGSSAAEAALLFGAVLAFMSVLTAGVMRMSEVRARRRVGRTELRHH